MCSAEEHWVSNSGTGVVIAYEESGIAVLLAFSQRVTDTPQDHDEPFPHASQPCSHFDDARNFAAVFRTSTRACKLINGLPLRRREIADHYSR